MAYDIRRVILFGVIGVITGTLIIAAVFMTSTLFQPVLPDKGNLIIKITDAPVELKNLNIAIDRFEVKSIEGDWAEVDIPEGEISFDLLQLYNSSIDVAMGEFSPGNFTMIRMHILSANATSYDGESFEVRVPSEKIKVKTPTFEIRKGESTIILLDMQVNTVQLANNPRHNLAPAMKIDVTVIYPKGP